MMMSLNMAYPCWDAPLPIILSKPLIEYQARTRRDISFCLCDKINFLESASAFNAARPPKVARSITKNSRAVAKQCAQAQIGDPFPFVSQIYQWNGYTTIGSPIYTSAVATLISSNHNTTYTFAPDLLLTVGGQYIAIVTNYPDGTTSLGGSGGGSIGVSSDTSGQGFYFNSYNSSGGWYDTDWATCCGSSGTNLIFQADFSDPISTTPIPAALPLFVGGLGVIGLLARRRKQKAAARLQ